MIGFLILDEHVRTADCPAFVIIFLPIEAELGALTLIERRFGDVIRQEFGVEPSALTASKAGYLTGFKDADAPEKESLRQDAIEDIAWGKEAFAHLRPTSPMAEAGDS